MSLLLAIDSSRHSQSATIYNLAESKLLATTLQQGKSSQLIPMLIKLFEDHGLDIKDVGLLATSIGPGSFTGIRTAVTIVKTLAAELNLEIIPLNNFELLRFEHGLQLDEPLVIRAGKSDYFISLDSNYDNLESNFYSLDNQGYQVYEFTSQNISKLMIDYINRDLASSPVDYKALKPYYIREPSINQHARSLQTSAN